MQITFVLLLFPLFYLLLSRWKMYTSSYGAPYVPLPATVIDTIIFIAKVSEHDVFYDLGSGDGRLVIAAAMKGAKSVGVESDWLRVMYSRLWIKLLNLEDRARIIHSDIFKVSLSEPTIIHTYLLQETNDKLQHKLETETTKGTKIISSAFTFSESEKIKFIATDPRGPIHGPLYLYIKT